MKVLRGRTLEEAARQFQPDHSNLPRPLPITAKTTPERVQSLWDRIKAPRGIQETLLGSTSREELAAYGGHMDYLDV